MSYYSGYLQTERQLIRGLCKDRHFKEHYIRASLQLLLVFIYASLSRIYYRNDHDISMIHILPVLLSQEPVVPTPLNYRFSVCVKHTTILYIHMLAKSLHCTSIQDPLFHVDHIRAVIETTQVLRYSGQQCMTTSRGTLIFILGLKMSQENSQPKMRFYVSS